MSNCTNKFKQALINLAKERTAKLRSQQDKPIDSDADDLFALVNVFVECLEEDFNCD